MKKILLLIAMGLGISTYAQEVIEIDADHFVVKTNGDTIFGKLKYMSSDDIKTKISVKVNDTLKYSLKASEVAYFKDGDKEYTTFQPEGEELHYFIKIEQRGKYLSLYQWQIPLEGGGGKVEFYYYLQKGKDKDYVELAPHWSKHLIEFIDDYEELADEVWKNKYKQEELPEVIKKYNEWKEDNK
jgi:hypothetical protein